MSQPPIYQPPPDAPPIPKKSNTVLWVVLIVGIGALCFGVLIMAAVLFPVFSQAKLVAQKSACLSNVKRSNLALIMYSADNNDHYPAGSKWMDKCAQYAGGDSAFRCPIVVKDVGPQAYGYGFNDALSEKANADVMEPLRTVALFESSDTGRNFHGGEADVANPGRHGTSRKGSNFGYADGSARFVEGGAASHIWKP